MIMWIYTIEPSLEIIQFEASETRGEYKVAYSEIIYVGFKLPKWPRRPVCQQGRRYSHLQIYADSDSCLIPSLCVFFLVNLKIKSASLL